VFEDRNFGHAKEAREFLGGIRPADLPDLSARDTTNHQVFAHPSAGASFRAAKMLFSARHQEFLPVSHRGLPHPLTKSVSYTCCQLAGALGNLKSCSADSSAASRQSKIATV
jgi:hypothetical protein